MNSINKINSRTQGEECQTMTMKIKATLTMIGPSELSTLQDEEEG